MKNRIFVSILSAGLALVAWTSTSMNSLAQSPIESDTPSSLWPEGISWKKDVPSPKEFFGFDLGQRHLRHDQIVEYLKVLDEKSDRLSLATYGQTQGGRPLLLLTITSTTNRARLDQIQSDHRKLNDPVVSDSVDIDTLPLVINMGYNVHGDEASAGNVAPLVAYMLAAGEGPFIQNVLDHCVVLLDPCLNPDGFQRFSQWVNGYQGLQTSADPAHAEHNQGWPSGRTNHYWFDLNRDWMPLTQLESQSRMKWFHQWKPDVVLDFHEMGSNSTFFFQPGEPLRKNPLTPAENVELTTRFGDYHAKLLDQNGAVYFTQEVYDDFYIGKGSTYPDLHGAVGILFEQGSARGQKQETTNGLLTFTATIKNQFSASRSSLMAAVDLRLKLLDYKRRFYRDSVEIATTQNIRTHVFTAKGNRNRLQAFADILLQHDIRCSWLLNDYPYGDQTFEAAWSLVVSSDQAEFRFLQSLLEKRKEFEENAFYDVSAWTLPLAFGLQHHSLLRSIPSDQLRPAELKQTSSFPLSVADTDVAYLIDWRDDRAAFWVNRLLEQEYLVKVAMQGLSVESGGSRVNLDSGTCLVALGQQTKDRAQLVATLQLASADGVRIQSVSSGLTPDGIDLGSSHFATIEPAHTAMFVGPGIGAYQAGEVWHALDTRFGMSPSMIQLSQVSRLALDRYSAIILPSGSYRDLNGASLDHLKSWLRAGGTMISIGTAAEFAATSLMEDAADDRIKTTNSDEKPAPIMRPFVSARDELALETIAGAIFETQVDVTHPLFFGFTDSKVATFRDHTRLLSRSPSPYANPAVYAQAPLLAGYCSAGNETKIAGTPCVVVRSLGSGRIILIADNPVFRGFWRGTEKLLVNAILFGDKSNPPASAIDGDSEDSHDHEHD